MGAPRVVTLSNSMIASIIQQADMQAAFPQLRSVSKQMKKSGKGGCRCRSNQNASRDRVINDFKTMLSGWNKNDKRKLKKMLNASEIRVIVGEKLVKF